MPTPTPTPMNVPIGERGKTEEQVYGCKLPSVVQEAHMSTDRTECQRINRICPGARYNKLAIISTFLL